MRQGRGGAGATENHTPQVTSMSMAARRMSLVQVPRHAAVLPPRPPLPCVPPPAPQGAGGRARGASRARGALSRPLPARHGRRLGTRVPRTGGVPPRPGPGGTGGPSARARRGRHGEASEGRAAPRPRDAGGRGPRPAPGGSAHFCSLPQKSRSRRRAAS